MRDNASSARLLVDDAAWAELANAGWPTGMMAAPAACAAVCPTAEWAVFAGDGAELRQRYPALDSALTDAGTVAVFGSGDQRVTVSRLDLPPADPGASSEDSARAHAGAALAASTRLAVSPDAAAELRAGRVDPRLIATIAALAALQPVRITAFPEVPGEESAGQPRRRVQFAAWRGRRGRLLHRPARPVPPLVRRPDPRRRARHLPVVRTLGTARPVLLP